MQHLPYAVCVCARACVQHLPYYPTATHSRCERDGQEETGGRRRQERAGGGRRIRERERFRCRKVKNEATWRLHPAAQRAWERCSAERYRGRGETLGGDTVCRICGSSSRPGTKASRTRSKSNQSVTTTASGKLPCARHTAGHSSMLQSPVLDAHGHA